MGFLNIKEILSKRRLKVLLISVAVGLLMMFVFSGKYRINLEAIAVSQDEQYIACFETGNVFWSILFIGLGCIVCMVVSLGVYKEREGQLKTGDGLREP